MQQAKEIKNRIKTISNVSKVTKSMEMISATRMKKSVRQYTESLPYSEALEEITSKILTNKLYDNVYTKTSTEVKNILILVIGPSKGFVGNLTSSMTSLLLTNIKQLTAQYPNAKFSSVSVFKNGLKIAKHAGLEDKFHFSVLPTVVNGASLVPIYTVLKESFLQKNNDLIFICYTSYVNSYVNKPIFTQLLPVNFSTRAKSTTQNKYDQYSTITFEPNRSKVLLFLLEEYFEKQVLNAIISSSAAEQSARMMSMRNATKNANKLKSKLVLNYNKGRQAQITEQIIEVASH